MIFFKLFIIVFIIAKSTEADEAVEDVDPSESEPSLQDICISELQFDETDDLSADEWNSVLYCELEKSNIIEDGQLNVAKCGDLVKRITDEEYLFNWMTNAAEKTQKRMEAITPKDNSEAYIDLTTIYDEEINIFQDTEETDEDKNRKKECENEYDESHPGSEDEIEKFYSVSVCVYKKEGIFENMEINRDKAIEHIKSEIIPEAWTSGFEIPISEAVDNCCNLCSGIEDDVARFKQYYNCMYYESEPVSTLDDAHCLYSDAFDD